MTDSLSSDSGVAPVLMAGMHRAGTSLLARLLQQAGLCIGADLDPNAESLLFMNWNKWVLQQAGCRWDHPEAWCLPGPVEARVRDQLQLIMQDTRSCQPFFGKSGQRPGSLLQHPAPWGWKDPRNTLTAPIWLGVFPSARVLIITRHGIDVAASLRRRASDALTQWVPKTGEAYSRRITDSSRCCTLEGGVTLWDAYMQAGERLRERYPDQVKIVRYEDLLAAPEPHLQDILAFCQLTQPVAFQPRTDRIFAYQHDPALLPFAAHFRYTLEHHGYAHA